MYLKKLRENGLIWFLRRIVKELVSPTTGPGKYVSFFSGFFYYLLSKPINFLAFKTGFHSKAKDTLYFFYDFDVEPITFDFGWALCIANARREELGLTHLRIIFVPGRVSGLRNETPDYDKIIGFDARNWRVNSIILPILQLLPARHGFVFCADRNEAMFIREKQAQFVYPEKYTVAFPTSHAPQLAMYYQQKMLTFKADSQAISYISEWQKQHAFNKKLIVITLRQYAFSPERNSNIAEWAKFANALNKEEFLVVFIPDTESALLSIPVELERFYFFKPACWNLNLRAALYELAYINLGVNNGPMILCWCNPNCAYITFKTFAKNVPQASLEVMIDRGFIFGQNPKFANQFQKWVWEEDVFELIHHEFLLMHDLLRTRTE